MSHIEEYYKLFKEIPYMPITGNLTDKEFNERVKRCVTMKVPLQELYPDDYNEPDGVLI